MGHGTAVPGHFDIDLVIYSHGTHFLLLLLLVHLSACLCFTVCLSVTCLSVTCLSPSLSLSLSLSLTLSLSLSLSLSLLATTFPAFPLKMYSSILCHIEIDGNAVLRQQNKFQLWLEKLHRFLSRALGHDYNYTGMTKRSVQFNYKGQVDVDLLVSPYWEKQHDLYKFLQTVPEENRSL